MRVRLAALVFLMVLSARTARAQALVDVEYGGANAFRDAVNGTTSAAGTLAVTRIHEGDTVQFAWPAGGSARNHNVFPYAPTLTTSASVLVRASDVMTLAPATSGTFTSAWNAGTRSRPYQCTAHRSAMNGVIYVYERAQRFGIEVPDQVVINHPFALTVSARGAANSVDGLYAGSVHVGSPETDAGMVLPADHAFVDGDSGTYRFEGLVFTVPGPRTIVVSEAGGGITTQISVNVAVCRNDYTFRNTHAIAIPGPKKVTTPTQGVARPYPSLINVTGVTGRVTRVTVTLDRASHRRPQDVDVLLVGPGGEKLTILSDVPAGPIGTTDPVSLVVTDTGTRPQVIKPVNVGAADSFPAPAPPPPYRNPAPAGGSTLTGTFAGRDPNGLWALYVVDDAEGATGGIAGGWSLDLHVACP